MLQRNWHLVGEAETPAEAEALEAVRALLPDDPLCHAWANLEFPDQTGHVNEVDLLLLVKQGLFVVELKGWHGRVTGRLNDWHVGNRSDPATARGNPVVRTDKKAKRLAGLLRELENEARGRVRIPYVAPAVVMHGRGSTIELSEQTKGSVFGLDGFAVKGVPAFTQLLRRSPKGAPLDKTTCDALVSLIQNSGLAPRTPRSQDPHPESLPPVAANPVADAEPTTDPAQSTTPPTNILEEITDEQLQHLGVAPEALSRVRAARDIESLIGRVPDEVWDDLEAVAGGDAVSAVVERRRLANERFAEVATAAASDGWVPEPAEGPGTEPEVVVEVEVEVADLPAAPVESDLERQLREAFGDRVTSRGSPRREETKRPVQLVKPETPTPAARPPEPLIPAETLLTLARTETLAGRTGAAQALHDRVRLALEADNKVDWTLREVSNVSAELRRFPLLSHRLDQMVWDLREGEPRAPALLGGPEVEIGSIWRGQGLGPAYSLLVRVPDVLDRRSGLFLSQLIGPEAARAVNARLRLGRPDGGRIRIVEDGTVISRRDAQSPWFVVGRVTPDEWFPPELVMAA